MFSTPQENIYLMSWATGGVFALQGQAIYKGISLVTRRCAASRSVLELFIGLSGADTMNLKYYQF